MPVGAIALWSPLNGAVPTDWAECDGTANSPGPDLRNRFVVGRGTDKTVDTTGGALTHVHAVHSTVLAHAHGLSRYPTTTGSSSGFTADTSMSGTLTPVTQPTDSTGSGSSYSHDSPNHEPKWYALIYIQRMT